MANNPLRVITTVVNGRISASARQAFKSFLPAHEGKNIVLEAKRFHKKRSLSQNAFYWKCVVPAVGHMFKDAGQLLDDEEVHAYLKEHIGKLVKIVHQPNGVRVRVVKSSKGLEPAEWEEYITSIRAWAGQFGVEIPTPNKFLEGYNG